ncbi:MAG: hypothetical protein J1D88_01725 [Treponema sp.]|nr:hypothetical protein [Treponema sp.]
MTKANPPKDFKKSSMPATKPSMFPSLEKYGADIELANTLVAPHKEKPAAIHHATAKTDACSTGRIFPVKATFFASPAFYRY